MLAVALSDELSAKEKKDILKKEYGIILNQKEEKEMKDMCDLADAIERKGMTTMLIQLLKKKLGNLKEETIELIRLVPQQSIDLLSDNFMKIEGEEEIHNFLIDS